MNWWYFGINAGLNFNEKKVVNSSNGVPTSLPKAVLGPIATAEGSFVLSDYQGDLMMSSDGISIYNKNNQVMDNGTGLYGGTSSTQSAIVIPAPNNPTKFFIVTAAEDLGGAGIQYDVVDLDSEDPNDLGAKEKRTSNDNLLKWGASCENLLAVSHANGLDYWFIHRTNSLYRVWLLNENGFVVPPKTYQTPALNSGSNHIGESIISPDHSKLVGFTYGGKEIISSNFNTTTGVISDIKVRKITGGNTYGGSFSPNGEYLYYTQLNGSGSGLGYKIKYDDLRSGNITPTALNLPICNIRMGPDKRLFGIRNTSKDLYVIMDPDTGGTDIRFFPNYLLGVANYGLPSFGGVVFSKGPKAKPFSCAGHSTELTVKVSIDETSLYKKLIWDFGDGSPRQEQLYIEETTSYKMNHFYANSGSYKVTVTPYIDGTVALTPVSYRISVIDCQIKSNLMIRQNLLNIDELEMNK